MLKRFRENDPLFLEWPPDIIRLIAKMVIKDCQNNIISKIRILCSLRCLNKKWYRICTENQIWVKILYLMEFDLSKTIRKELMFKQVAVTLSSQ